MLFTPKRKAIYEEVKPALEELLSHPVSGRAYLMGSFATEKPNPSDLDIVLRPTVGKHSGEVVSEYFNKLLGKSRPKSLDVQLVPWFSAPGTRGKYLEKGWEEEGAVSAKPFLEKGREKYGPEHKWIRILGLTGALAGGTAMMEPEEAGAMPIGKAFKSALKPALKKAPVSSAEKFLLGTKFKGAIIEKVVQGSKPNLRYILTDDGFAHPVTKDVLNDLVRAAETTRRTGSAARRIESSQVAAAYKSLDFHIGEARDAGRLNPYITRDAVREYFKDYRKQLQEAGVKVPPTSLVTYIGEGLYKGKSFTMPSYYADILQKEGVLKIVERLER